MLSRLIAFFLPVVPRFVVGRVARRYVAGDDLESGLRTIAALNREQATATLALLGEEVENEAAGEEAVKEYLAGLEGIAERELASGVSVKPTNVGLRVDEALCLRNLERLVEVAAERDNFVRIDMEDRTTTDATLRMYAELSRRHDNVGVVLQAYLRRTLRDIAALPAGAHVRLCKGIYLEPRTIAWKDRESIRLNFLAALDALLERDAFVAIATHDEVMVAGACALLARRGTARDRYEFQTLLGVDDELRRSLVSAGHPLRVYVPYGVDWYAYSMRRLRENPALAGYVLRALLRPGAG